MITSGGDREKRPTRILRALRQSPAGLSTPQIVAELAEGIEPPKKALTWYGGILRRQQEAGDVERAGRTPGAWQQCPAIIWRLTGSGEKLLACIDEAPVREAEQERLAADAGRVRASALADAARTYSRDTPRIERRIAVARLRKLGCTLEEIGQVFGVSREMARKDLLPCEPKPHRFPGPRLMGAAVLNDMLAVAVGKRTLYFTRIEAAHIAEVIGRWDERAGD